MRSVGKLKGEVGEEVGETGNIVMISRHPSCRHFIYFCFE